MRLPHPGGDLQRAGAALQQHVHPVSENTGKKERKGGWKDKIGCVGRGGGVTGMTNEELAADLLPRAMT